MKRNILVAAGAAVLVTGVVAGGVAFAHTRFAKPAPVPAAATVPPSATPPSPPSTQPTKTGTAWAGSTRFMEIKDGAVRGGTVVLNVRPAKKVPLGESFSTEPIPGPFTEVTMANPSRALLLDGESGSPEVFVDMLKKRTKDQVGEGFNVIFDRQGKVTTVEWLYNL